MKDYKKILEGVVDIINTTEKSDIGFANICTYIGENCPELAESKNERIRKRIIHALHGDVLEMSEIKEAVAWLEKQGNLMKALQISNAKIGELIEKNYYLKEQLEKQSEQKPTDKIKPKFKVGDIVKHKDNPHLTYILKRFTDDGDYEFHAIGKDGNEGCTCFSVVKYQDEWELVEQKPTVEMKTTEESLGIDSDTYNKIVDECVYGEQKPIKEHNACEFCEDRYGCVNPCSMKLIEEENPADKVEPKFREGDWVVYCNDDVDLITGIEENGYCINNGGYIPFICENEMRLWDITDAKVGDVLVSESTCCLGTWYCIFKSLDGDESMTVYCYLSRDGRFETKKELCFDKDPYNTKPATKEQRNTLLKAMSDAGYKWDAEKKELKNIEEEYNGEDYGIDGLYAAIDILQKTLGEVDGYQSDDGILTHKCAISAVKELSKQKSAWSEEDEKMLNDILMCGEHHCYLDAGNITWLKSLKDRYTWKPSDEQMITLRHVISGCSYDIEPLVEMEEQLKKLMEEDV